MIGKYRELITYYKDLNPDIQTILSDIHRQKKLSVRLNDLLNFMIKAVNKIKKHALQSRLFKQLCYDNDKVFYKLIMYT